MFALVTAASASNHNTRVLELVIWRKPKLVVAATVYPNASGPGAADPRAQPGHNRQTASVAVDCPLVIVYKPKGRGCGCLPAVFDLSDLRLFPVTAAPSIRSHPASHSRWHPPRWPAHSHSD